MTPTTAQFTLLILPALFMSFANGMLYGFGRMFVAEASGDKFKVGVGRAFKILAVAALLFLWQVVTVLWPLVFSQTATGWFATLNAGFAPEYAWFPAFVATIVVFILGSVLARQLEFIDARFN